MGTESLLSPLSTHASRRQIDPMVVSGQGAATAARPRESVLALLTSIKQQRDGRTFKNA